MSESRRTSKARTVALVGAAVLAVVVATAVVIDRRTRPVLLTGPMIQMPRPDTLVIVWEMDDWFEQGVTRLSGPAGVREVAARPVGGRRYEAVFEDVPAGGPYTYTIMNRGLLGRKHALDEPRTVSMPAARGESFRFIVFGDSGNGSNTQTALAERMAAREPDVVIHVGDLVYTAGARQDYPFKFYDPNERLLHRAFFMPSLGNHDCATRRGQPMLDEFVLPENGPPGVPAERNYWFDFGDARFVALDSNVASEPYGGVLTAEQMGERVAPWLRQVLTDCDARWKFVYFHHPIYTGSPNHSIEDHPWMRDVFLPVIEETGVDMVFAGHNHLYERSASMRGGEIVADGAGTVYITTGAGGVNRYPEADTPPAFIVSHNDEVFSFTEVNVEADRLELRQIDETGGVIDEYVIDKAPGN